MRGEHDDGQLQMALRAARKGKNGRDKPMGKN